MIVVGDVEVVPIVELDASDVIRGLLPDATPEALRDAGWLASDFCARDGRLKAAVQTFLVRSDGANVLVDTCVGDDKSRTEFPQWARLRTGFLDRLRAAGVEPADVTTVVCTHLHVDHVGWNTQLRDSRWRPTFPTATHVFVRTEYERAATDPSRGADNRAAFEDSVEPIVEAGMAELVEADERIDAHLSLVPTPGHTAGHVSVAIESADVRALITGDLLHHPCQLAFPAWSATADEDPELAATTRARVFGEIADSDTVLIGSHFVTPQAGLVVRNGDGFELRADGRSRPSAS